MGISAGGALSLFSAAVDTRIKAAVVSCYFNEIKSSTHFYTLSLPLCREPGKDFSVV